MADYAGYLLNRLEVGKDGKTAYERTKVEAATVLGVEFGEKLLWKRKTAQKMNRVNLKWEYRIFVGVRPERVRKVRAVRRIAFQERWSTDSIGWVKHVPWHRYKGQEDANGDIPEGQAEEADAVKGGAEAVRRQVRGVHAAGGAASLPDQERGRREARVHKGKRWLLELVSWTWAAATLRGVSCEVCRVDERRCEVQER